jgi:hypothetical protein
VQKLCQKSDFYTMPQKGIQWLQMYKWLHFDGEGQLMSCDSHSDWCTKFGKDDPDGKFVNGTDNFKKDKGKYLNKFVLF